MPGHAPGRTFYSLPAMDSAEAVFTLHVFTPHVDRGFAEMRDVTSEIMRRALNRLACEILAAVRVTVFPARRAEHAEAFLDFARRGDQASFLELAGCLGIPPEEHEAMWAGTRRRLGRSS